VILQGYWESEETPSTFILKQCHIKRSHSAAGVAQAVEHLPRKYKVLSSKFEYQHHQGEKRRKEVTQSESTSEGLLGAPS
jgi:hypothetical protein